MGGISSPIASMVADVVAAPISRLRFTGPPPGYTWLLFNGQKVYFNGEPVYVKEST